MTRTAEPDRPAATEPPVEGSVESSVEGSSGGSESVRPSGRTSGNTSGRPSGSTTSQEPTRKDWLAGARWHRSDIVAAVVVGLLVVAVAYAFRSIVVPTDPWHYVRAAMRFPDDTWVPLGYTRYGIILANIPPVVLFGNAQAAYYFWPLLSAGVLSGSVYLLGARWWGRVAGLVAVVLMVTNSVVFYNLSRGYPDIMSMAIFTLALVLALLVRDRVEWDRWSTTLTVLVGFLLGWGFETRETSMLAWPLIAVVLWRRGRVLRTIVLVALPVLFWAALDIGISAVAYGDPLLKFHVLTGIDVSATRTATGELANGNLVNQPRWTYFTFIPKMALDQVGGLSMVVIWGLAALGIFVRNGAMRLMAWWFLGVYLLTVLAAGGLDPAHPSGRLDIVRYWIPFVPPASLVVGGMVAMVAAALARRWSGQRSAEGSGQGSGQASGEGSRAGRRVGAAVAVVLAVAVCAVPFIQGARYAATNTAFAPSGADALEELRSHLDGKDFSTTRVWTDWETARILPAYQREFFGGDKVWKGAPKSITGPNADPAPGEYVLLFRPGSKACTFCLNALRPWTQKNPSGPPSSWQPVFTSSEGTLVLYQVR